MNKQIRKIAYTVDEAAEAGPIKRGKIYSLIKAGKLSAHKAGRRTFIFADEFERLLRGMPALGGKSNAGVEGE